MHVGTFMRNVCTVTDCAVGRCETVSRDKQLWRKSYNRVREPPLALGEHRCQVRPLYYQLMTHSTCIIARAVSVPFGMPQKRAGARQADRSLERSSNMPTWLITGFVAAALGPVLMRRLSERPAGLGSSSHANSPRSPRTSFLRRAALPRLRWPSRPSRLSTRTPCTSSSST